jgi:hypothetical protein
VPLLSKYAYNTLDTCHFLIKIKKKKTKKKKNKKKKKEKTKKKKGVYGVAAGGNNLPWGCG